MSKAKATKGTSGSDRRRKEEEEKLPNLWETIAIVCSDLHITLTPPPARAGEPDWLRRMASYFEWLESFTKQGEIPILCAGDVFDHWKAPPELINWAIDKMPKMYAIPGQHDIPYHNLELLHKSAYHTLAKAGRIMTVHRPLLLLPGRICLHSCHWGEEPEMCKESGITHILLMHKFVWTTQIKQTKGDTVSWEHNAYPGASNDSNILLNKSLLKVLESYDAVVIGDNHKHWQHNNIFNCGTFMRRKSDEWDYLPRFGRIQRHRETGEVRVRANEMNILTDVFCRTTADVAPMFQKEIGELIDGLKELQETGVDFIAAVRRTLDRLNVRQQIREVVLSLLE